jgi:hypothetical protein
MTEDVWLRNFSKYPMLSIRVKSSHREIIRRDLEGTMNNDDPRFTLGVGML